MKTKLFSTLLVFALLPLAIMPAVGDAQTVALKGTDIVK